MVAVTCDDQSIRELIIVYTTEKEFGDLENVCKTVNDWENVKLLTAIGKRYIKQLDDQFK